MKSFFGKTIVKKTISVILVLAVAAGVAFAAPLKIQTGLGDAKVYDSQYKAVKNPVEVSDNFVLRTSTTPVILNTDTISVEVEPNSLLQFISLDKEVVFYLLDGKAAFTSNVAFEVRTPVTKYKSQAGTAIYVITEEAEETAYVNAGQAEATNLITGEVTQIAKGTTIDSTKKTAQTSSTTREDYWKASSAPAAQAEQKPAETKQEQEPVVEPVVEPAAEPEKAAEVQPAEEAVTETVVTNLGALEHTFSYRGITATLRAYIGYAELEYPEYVTTEEIDAAARAAVLTFPETVTQDIRYEVAKPGLALIYYPETYGPTEFEMAIYLLDQELPGYIDALLAPAAAPEQQKAEEQPQQQSEQAQAATQPAEAPVQPTVRETIESKVEKPAQTTEPAPAEEPVEEKKGFRFGASVGFIYGHGDRGDYFADPVFLHERFGVFMKNYMAIIDPIFSFGNFSFGLHLVADFRSGSFVNPIDNLRFDSVTGAVNSVMQFVSVINYTKGNFSFNVDRTSNLEFTSPIFTKHDRNYDHDSKLLATMKYNNQGFGFTAFVDDLQLNAKIEGRSQFAGARMSYLLGKMDIGISVVADIKNGFRKMTLYLGGDAKLPFTIKGVDFNLEGGAVGAWPLDETIAKAAMIEGKFNKTSGLITFGIGGAYSVRYNFNDIINNGPTDVISTPRGRSVDLLASVGVNMNHFRFSVDVRAPFRLKADSRLIYNTVLTKYGNTATISADTMNFEAEVFFGKFTFTAGAVFNGFAGRVVDFVRAIRDREGRRAALAGMVDPDISTFFAKAEFAPTIGPVDLSIYVRADVMTVKDKIAVPFSAGARVSF